MADISKIKLPNGSEYLFKDIKALSRGEQLVTNGSGMIGDNTNFSSWIFDGSQSNGSPGSFTRTSKSYANIATDDLFPVDTSRKYAFEFDMKSLNNVGHMYSMLLFYDVDKIAITADNHMYYSGTLTRLTQELKSGDTVVYLEDASNYSTKGTGSHHRALTFWDYKNSFGYQYPPETYSRYYLGSAWTDDTSIDKVNNTITLARPYSGVTHAAGTYVSQGTSGGTYKYVPLGYTKIPTDWTHYIGYFDGTDYSGTNINTKFPPGTAYCKVGFLWNYSSEDDQFWLTNVSVKEFPNTADTSNGLKRSTALTSATIDSFRDASCIKAANITGYSGKGLADNDGMVVWIPYSANYGHQFLIDDNGYHLSHRYYYNGTWSEWQILAAQSQTSANILLNLLSTGSSTPTDNDYYISQYVGGGTTTTTYHRRPVSALWEYIKGKISSVLGLTATAYGGKAATAGNADTVNNCTVNTDVPTDAIFTDTQSDWSETNTTSKAYINNKPNLATVATSGSYNDLANKPTIPEAQVNADWNSTSGLSRILNKPTLGAAASRGVASSITSSGTGLTPAGLVYDSTHNKVPNTRKVNNKALSNDISIDPTDIELDQDSADAINSSTGSQPQTLKDAIEALCYDGIDNCVPTNSVGAAGGVAALDGNGKVPSSQLPSGFDIPVIDRGHISVGTIAANSVQDKSVPFTKTFTSAPNVTATLFSSGTAVNIGNVSISVYNITTSGFNVKVFNNRSSTLSPAIEWIAVGS